MTYFARLNRFLRRHATALIAIVVCNFVVFFPVAFMGRVVSPNDVFFSYSPWSSMRPDTWHPQNLLINDPPTSYYTMLARVKSDWRIFHWNPYIACGMPGFGSSGDSSLTPIVLLPVLLLPLTWSYTGILFLKLNLSFLFAYLWLREEHLGRRGAAVGAIVIAAAGAYSVRWLWQITNATVFYPALLWIVRRTLRGKQTSIALVAIIALSFGISGFPAAIAYGAWIAIAYAIYLGVVRAFSRSAPEAHTTRPLLGSLARTAAAGAIALLLAFPTLIPFVQLVKRSGYLETRQQTSLQAIYPPTHWASFIDADRLGNPASKNWRGDAELGVLNNYVEATVYLGALALLLALLGLWNRHARARGFWVAAALLILMCMFGFPGVSQVMAHVPGVKYSALARTVLLLPLAAGYLAAAGAERLVLWIRRFASLRAILAGVLAAAVAFDLGLVAGRFHPYLDANDADVPATPVIEFMQRDHGPFRIAGFFDYFWPNSAELFQLEDVRSHFGSEGDYRRLLQRLDPEVWNGHSTVLQFNSLKYNFTDPLAGMLGIRYYLEHKYIDIIKWSIFAATVPGVPNRGPIALAPGAVMQRTIRIDAEPVWAVEVPCSIEASGAVAASAGHSPAPGARAAPQVEITLVKDGAAVWSRRFTKADADVMSKLYVPVHGVARLGDVLTLRVRSIGARASLNGGDGGFYYGRVMTPVIWDRDLPDGRVFRNLSELPRFWSVTKFRKFNRDEFLKARDVDFANEAVITDDPVMPPPVASPDAHVTLARYEPDEQHVLTNAPEPMFLASSEKLTPELRVTIDGRGVRPTEINMLFAGVAVPAGRHEVVYSRRIGRGWWWVAMVGLVLWLAAAAWELTASRRRRRSDRRTARATAA
jgi:hypothetical protein